MSFKGESQDLRKHFPVHHLQILVAGGHHEQAGAICLAGNGSRFCRDTCVREGNQNPLQIAQALSHAFSLNLTSQI